MANVGGALSLLVKLRRVHRVVQEVEALVLGGEAVVSEEEREALLAEMAWLHAAFENISAALAAPPLDQAITDLLDQ